ncbi:sigma-54-dependent Fis family transcriptional regulator [Nitrospira sp. T9]|uniref:sigma-54-dependent Fis family transcriptional regulator n=1 Tax=unclassified Nitrospira TaxID=2652172 RepID=UPI003F9B8A08
MAEVGTTSPFHSEGEPVPSTVSAQMSSLGPIPVLQDEVLQRVVKGVEAQTGEKFFDTLVEKLVRALGVKYAYLSEFNQADGCFYSKAGWSPNGLVPRFQVPVGGPCEVALNHQVVHHADGLADCYPNVQVIKDWGATSYCGLPLINSSGKVAGHLAVLDDKPMPNGDYTAFIMRIFAARALAEIERVQLDQALRKSDYILRLVDEGTASTSGGEFFQALACNLAKALGVRYAFVGQLMADTGRVRTLAFWNGEAFIENFEYNLEHSPCQQVLAGEICHFPERVQQLFPHEKGLADLGAESYLAIPLLNQAGEVLGHLAALDVRPMAMDARLLPLFRVFGARAGAELERQKIHARLAESEEQLRDLFDEAPIAYVNEGLDSRFIRANRVAMQTLGITPDQVEGTYGKSFIPDTPDAQKRMKEVFDSIGQGTDTGGVVLELRRKDTGKPLWIQWWSRPDPSGTYTRTMFLDITDKVLMEQEKARLEAQNTYLREEIQSVHNFEEVIGSSSTLKKVLRNVERVAPTDSTVLVTGETGTGKELIARAIHNLSPRKSKPLVKVNCAAIPAGLIESELFGHEKGAFTGALTKKIGRFELADKGTIFLDEIGELPLDLQAKLLRVLQEGEFERVGGTQTFKVNVRVIAATNRDLEQLSRTGQYRSDLYYRLNVFPIHLPSLREREGDIPLLAQYFVRKCATNLGKKIDRIPESMMASLRQYAWPGNIRELEHVIERAVILTEGSSLEPIELSTGARGDGVVSSVMTLEERERLHIMDILEQTGWRVSGKEGAAELLGLKPTTLEARMKKLGITRKK